MNSIINYLRVETDEERWKSCRVAHKECVGCEGCKDRFKCWTASEPIDYVFAEFVDAVKNTQLYSEDVVAAFEKLINATDKIAEMRG